jgi:hypothetical protein
MPQKILEYMLYRVLIFTGIVVLRNFNNEYGNSTLGVKGTGSSAPDTSFVSELRLFWLTVGVGSCGIDRPREAPEGCNLYSRFSMPIN